MPAEDYRVQPTTEESTQRIVEGIKKESIADKLAPKGSPHYRRNSNTTNEGTTMKNIHTSKDRANMRVYGLIALADQSADPRQELVDKLWRILGAIDLAENFSLRIGVDEKVPAPYGAIFIQVRCWRRDVITGEWGFGWGGKATVSPFQTESEIVGMAFGLYKSYFEHEARETFKFEDRRIFGPHIDIRALHSIARKVDVRSAQHTTDKL